MEMRGSGPYRFGLDVTASSGTTRLIGDATVDASSKALHPKAGFPDPVSIDRLPLPFLRPARVPDNYPL